MHDDPTPRLVFPDTTVLINFALVDEMPLLGQLVANNGSWCGTVASECDDQASKQGLPHMRDAHARGVHELSAESGLLSTGIHQP